MTDKHYHYVVIGDTAACCSLGIEFDADKIVKSYPQEETQVEVIGTFSTYEELGTNYYYLDASSLSVVE